MGLHFFYVGLLGFYFLSGFGPWVLRWGSASSDRGAVRAARQKKTTRVSVLKFCHFDLLCLHFLALNFFVFYLPGVFFGWRLLFLHAFFYGYVLFLLFLACSYIHITIAKIMLLPFLSLEKQILAISVWKAAF